VAFQTTTKCYIKNIIQYYAEHRMIQQQRVHKGKLNRCTVYTVFFFTVGHKIPVGTWRQ
jgi:hypothetical protein